MTLISAIRLAGATACRALEDATDTEAFRAYVREGRAPPQRSGDLVVLDNLRRTKVTRRLL